jgi:hypothetical protein
MPQDVIDRVHVLARRSNANRDLAFAWGDGTEIADEDEGDDQDSDYDPDDEQEESESESDTESQPDSDEEEGPIIDDTDLPLAGVNDEPEEAQDEKTDDTLKRNQMAHPQSTSTTKLQEWISTPPATTDDEPT